MRIARGDADERELRIERDDADEREEREAEGRRGEELAEEDAAQTSLLKLHAWWS